MTELIIRGSQEDIAHLTNTNNQRNCGNAPLTTDKRINKYTTTWDTAHSRETKSRPLLRRFLCSRGYRTDGGCCPNCPSSCAFGLEYSTKYAPIPPEMHVRTIVTATTPEGTVTTFTGFAEAARRLGLKKGDRLRLAAIEGRLFHGYYWHRDDLEMKEASE